MIISHENAEGGSVLWSGSVACPEKVNDWPTCHWVFATGASINAVGGFPTEIKTRATSNVP